MMLNINRNHYFVKNTEFSLSTLFGKPGQWLQALKEGLLPGSPLENECKLVETPVKFNSIRFAGERAIRRHGAFLYHQNDR